MPQANRLKLPSAPPRVQVENFHLWNDGRSPASADFFTVGYTGRKGPELFDALVGAGVRALVDIRLYPVSMYRPEMSKGNLARALSARGIEYIHVPELGVPRDVRAKAIDAGTRDVIWQWYDDHVLVPYLGRNLDRFLNMTDHPAALMCVETDPRECHRHRLFLALEDRGLRGFEL
jgi:uncharacterized protein (DUF488 family)